MTSLEVTTTSVAREVTLYLAAMRALRLRTR